MTPATWQGYVEPVPMSKQAAITAQRQAQAGYHREGLHIVKVSGCPYCYPPGPRGDYTSPAEGNRL